MIINFYLLSMLEYKMNKKQVMMIIAAFLIGIAVCKLMDSGSCGAPGCTGAGCKKCNGGGSLIEGLSCGTEGYRDKHKKPH